MAGMSSTQFFNIFISFNFLNNIFQKVWLGIGVSIVCVATVFILIQRFLSHLPENLNSNKKVESSGNDNLEGQDGRHPVISDRDQSGKQFLYVIGNLLSQGFNLFEFVIYDNKQ